MGQGGMSTWYVRRTLQTGSQSDASNDHVRVLLVEVRQLVRGGLHISSEPHLARNVLRASDEGPASTL